MATATGNGVELYYDVIGAEGAPTVAFSNSLGGTIEAWDGVIPSLAAYRCVRYDTRGHGRSRAFDTAVSIDDLATDFAAVLDAAGVVQAHVVGLSLGGVTVQAFALQNPERVLSLTLIDTGPHLPPAELWTDRAATVRAKGIGAVVDAVVARWFTAAFTERAPATVERVRDRFLAVDPAGYACCCEAIAATDLRDRIRGIGAPALVMVGAEDQVTPPAVAEELRAALRDAELVVVPNAAHLMPVERPGAVAAHLRAFLDRQGDAASAGPFEHGLAIRESVVGEDYVAAATANAGAFAAPWQDLATRVAWGEIWGDPTLPRKTRSMLTLAMMVALHREEEFKLHARAAIGNGVTFPELRALVMQTAVYAGFPAANAAFRWLRETLGNDRNG